MAKSHPSSQAELPWSVPLAMEDVPESGRHVELVPPDDALPAIAKLANVRSIEGLRAKLDVMPVGDGLHVRGRVSGRVGQTCVVTLEPIENEVDEAVDISFSSSATAAENEVAVSPGGGGEPPEPLSDGVVDLAAVVMEFLLLGVDPYPRKTGAQFKTTVAGNPQIEPRPNPFAVLEALKKRDGGE